MPPRIQEIPEAESDGEADENIDSLENPRIKIPYGLPGSRNSRSKPSYPFNRSRPESINIGNSESVRKPRGRPPGSGRRKSNSAPTTEVENFWTGIAALGLNFTSALLAARVMNNPKYIMTKAEAESAAKAIMIVAWKYKQFREFALIVNTDSDWAIIARGFWPYLSRVFMKELMDYVLAGLFMGGASRKSNGNGKGTISGREIRNEPITRQSDGQSPGGFNGGFGSGNSNGEFSPEFLGNANWRDVG